MLKNNSPNHFAHVAIHVMSCHFKNLSHERRIGFPKMERDFVDYLWEQHRIPTIWTVGKENSEDYILTGFSYPENATDAARSADLQEVGVRQHETIFMGNHENVFRGKIGGSYIRKIGGDSVLLTGMNSPYCVAMSASGAVLDGFRCIVINDLLACAAYPIHEDWNAGNPEWHKEQVQKNVGTRVRKKN